MMISSENTSKRSVYRKVAVFLPKTLSVRLAVLGLVFFYIAVILPVRFEAVEAVLVTIVSILLTSALAAAISNSLRGEGHRLARVFRTLAVAVASLAAFFAVLVFARFLAFMSAGGNGNFLGSSSSPSSSWDAPAAASFGLVLVSVVLLLWIPEVFFRIQLDMSGTGNAQRVLLALITVASCTATGIFILLLHFWNGPLRNVSVGPLVVGTIGTVLLVAHPYRSLARVCWQRGVAGVFSFRAHKQQWYDMVTELQKAIDGTTERNITPSKRQPN